ncbi:thioredoxin domain-containing protein [Microvirga massiliensis]|uniref:thioredoxin domain-containing protein n=1 Tax=Microvirga massiliensis TaxID=1033741 RepID=UPI00062BD8D9|nr:thioredoxin domain-containing protein [Microvirga massiliensis]
MNRLASASSPYLLQHKDNPVHWWEWGPEAFAEAQRLNRPVLLSVGYAACHWCHVMAHESFEDEATAALMNELFVNIKVDREERPDVDHVYMTALQALGERGGWPLTMFLTPKGEPFWGGTYFPKRAGFGRPSFEDVLRQISLLYHAEPDRIAYNRELLKKSLSEQVQRQGGGTLGLADLDAIGTKLVEVIDPEHGGIRGAPKFPNPTILELLARYARRSGDRTARDRFLLTLEQMARGGIHDHLGGGFARYSTDERWLVPHFEKMLYDNAQLLELFALAAAETGRSLFREAATGIVTWLQREMTTPEGAFASSLDADSEGEEGRYYVWSLAEVREVLGEDAALFERIYDITEEGNWEGTNIPNRLLSGEVSADLEDRLWPLRDRLLKRREARIRPGLDDKVLADWNGLMIASLVRAGLLLDRPDWTSLAERAYRFVRDTMSRDGGLGHSWRGGSLVFPGFALDHAAMMRAALSVYEATGRASYLHDARRWAGILADEYRVPETGVLAMTAKGGEHLVARPQPTHDDVVPNANGAFAEGLVRLAALTGDEGDRQGVEQELAALSGIARASLVSHASILNALDQHLRGLTIIVTQDEDGALTKAALKVPYLDRTVCLAEDLSKLSETHPAKAQAGQGAGPQALVCAGMRCSLPLTQPDDLTSQASEMATNVS